MMPYNPASLQGNLKHRVEQESAQDTRPRYSSLYFGYASNLSWQTMKQRCPDSLFTGLARLDNWKWAINSTRYANIVRSAGDCVYGTLSFLSNRDEAALDESEGVPWNMQKLKVPVVRLNQDGSEMLDETTGEKRVVEAVAYVDEVRTNIDGEIEKDYIVLINKGIKDGLACGLPQAYIDKYLRPFTPLPVRGDEDITLVRTTEHYGLPNFPRAPSRPE